MTNKAHEHKEAPKVKNKAHTSEETIEEIKETLLHAQETAVDYVKKNPLKAMGMTLLAGVVLAQIMRSRK
jgi:hypothetical protein